MTNANIGEPDGSSRLSIETIIPVRNMRDHIRPCLEPLLAQSRRGDVITVIDDGSTDGSGEVAESLGAQVVAMTGDRGPYFARHVVAAASAADVVLFVDGRSRALDGLVDTHRRLFADPGVALSCTDVSVVAGRSFASRVAAAQNTFALERYIGVKGRPDYYPTCNLGVRRSAYQAVGGFREVRAEATPIFAGEYFKPTWADWTAIRGS